MADGVLAVFAHPDDESLLAGGVLAASAAAGLRVAIVSMTRGERGPVADPAPAGPGGLAALREAELRAAADVLGASAVECLRYPDGELADVDEERAVSDLARVLQRERPRAAISFASEGLYWHPDHLAVLRFLMAALERPPEDASSPWLYGATWPVEGVQRLVAEMRARGLPTDLWGIDPRSFGAPEDSITASLDVRRFLPAKLRALRCHRSQLGADHLLSVVPGDLAEEFLGWEHFVRLAPPDAREDRLTAMLG